MRSNRRGGEDHCNGTRAPPAKSRVGCPDRRQWLGWLDIICGGGVVEPQEEDAGRELLHDFLRKCELMLAPDGRTWVPTRGQKARIDHMICPQRWLPMLRRAVTADFSPGIADKEDHRPVFAKFVLREDCGMTAGSCLRQAECRLLLARVPPTPGGRP